MMLLCFFIVALLSYAAAFSPPQFMVTDMAVTTGDSVGRVEFHGLLPGRKQAVILKNIIKTDRFVRRVPLVGKKHFVYTAEIVEPDKFQSAVDTCGDNRAKGTSTTPTLLCLHGFNTQPDSWLEECSEYSGNATVIPVVWAAADGSNAWRTYWADRNNAPAVGDAFEPLLTCTRGLKNKSLMCHSMGNFVLKWASPAIPLPPKERFCDIFMVAPDADRDLFTQAEGQNILNLVQNQVHVLHAKNDVALRVRQTVVLRRPALGLSGDPTGRAVNVDCRSFSRKADPLICHSYQFHPSAVRYYETLANDEKGRAEVDNSHKATVS